MKKKCECGKYHYNVPENSRLLIEGEITDGVCWECTCHSTLFVSVVDLKTYGIYDTLDKDALIENNRKYQAKFLAMVEQFKKV